eukprot:CAMPEP_0172406372 /NCGR_PEP_ID=MMETSP1061-20121228/70424_1 /TAXON_ID=37318 /ORGANISM="Pseudo-nitzschia pungens, Strain cf. pungens" /LENGTH=125 /DNA_ID=CAMNT_0013141937 /DNA_START=42 /DNA_END=416 /DNA_ORIENTATION=-
MMEGGADHSGTMLRSNSGDGESSFPPWMEDYFEWHRSVRSNLTETNWNETNYLILSCMRDHRKCGGVSDRLKPLPLIVFEAFRSKRLLLIWWDRPKRPEECFVPPEGGIDWTVPSFLRRELLRSI